MKNKKFFLFTFIIIFCLIIIALLFLTFSIKNVKVTFICADEEEQTLEIQSDLEELEGKNLIFLSKEKIIDILEKYPSLELFEYSKSFPSTLNISVKERHKSYYLETNDKKLILSDEAIVISNDGQDVDSLIKLDFSGTEYFDKIEVVSCNIGEKLVTNFDEYIEIMFAISKKYGLTDKISGINVFVKKINNMFDIEFNTNTKASIYISEAFENGLEKAEKVFSLYDNIDLDYKKTENDKYYFYIDKNLDPKFIVRDSSES